MLIAAPFDYLMLFLWVFAYPVLSALTGKVLAGSQPSQVARYWAIIIRSVLLSLLFLDGWHWMGRPYAALGLDTPISRGGLFGLLFDAALLGIYVYGLFVRELSPERVVALRKLRAGNNMLPQSSGEVALFSVTGMFGGIYEELIYRGFFFWLLTPLIGVWGAVLVTSALFGLGHAYDGARGILSTAIVGLAAGAGFALTHSLWWLMVAHAMANIYAALFTLRLANPPAVSAQ